jgi:hypothetical protein
MYLPAEAMRAMNPQRDEPPRRASADTRDGGPGRGSRPPSSDSPRYLMPAVARELTDDHRRPRAIAIVEDLQEVLPLGIFEADEPPVVENQHLDPSEPRQERRVGAIAVRQRDFRKQPRVPPVDHAIAVPAGLLAQGTPEKCSPTPLGW